MFHLPWNQSDHYWVCLSSSSAMRPELVSTLSALGLEKASGNALCYHVRAAREWSHKWREIDKALASFPNDFVQVSVVAGEAVPDGDTIQFHARTPAEINRIADNLWLGEAIREEKLQCYLQPIHDRREKIFGYEAFARMTAPDGSIIGGGKIIGAAQALDIEHLLDRYLHVQAIKTFITSDMAGFLFINFVPGFIHRPEKYLEKLTECVRQYAMPPKHLVLDFMQSGTTRDLSHLKAIFEYCRSNGYCASLDDIEDADNSRALILETRPDFIKLDIQLIRQAKEKGGLGHIKELVTIAHQAGASVVAEGVEDKETLDILMQADVDLFQGYYFSPAVAATPSALQAKA